MDPRIRNLARTLVHYSLPTQPGQTVEVSGYSDAEPLFTALYEELLRAGAFPELRMLPEATQELFFKHANDSQLETLPPYRLANAKHMDTSIRIISSSNTRALSSIDPKKQARHTTTLSPWKERLLNKPWVLTLFPTAAFAQDAEMSLTDFEDFVYHATFSDEKDPVKQWKALAARQEKLIARLHGADHIRITGPDTDLALSVKGRLFVNSAGTHNMPSGEIFTSPVDDSAEGFIKYDFPVCHGGREIHGIRLVFKKGRVVEASAEKNEPFLLEMLNMDPGARRLGELGIGTNTNIQRFIKNILFDEKIGGTIHLAVGAAYPEAGGINNSALHWDMIKDLRQGGALYVDGKLFQRNGRFVQS